MWRRTAPRLIGMSPFGVSPMDEQGDRRGWKDLFFKPKTRDERVKDYVPEVLEESLEAQRTVLAEQTTRDLLVERGHRVLRELENKAPTPTIFPEVNEILKLYGRDKLITQRGLNYLLYPSSSSAYQQHDIHELVGTFHDNFRLFVEHLEQEGSYVHDVKIPRLEAAAKEGKAQGKEPEPAAVADGEEVAPEEAAPESEQPEAPAEPQEAEPADVTYFVKVVAGLGMANVHIGDNTSAVQCCDAALSHAMDTNRRGGLYGMKAGALIRLKKYDDALEAATKAIAESNNAQGYLQGASALLKLGRKEEALELLGEGQENLPQHEGVTAMLEAIKERDEQAKALPADGEQKPTRLGAKREQKLSLEE